jgi:ubiquinone/menaquinone biosynthesis C-methylase UbiE
MEEPKRRVVAAFDLASTTYDEPTLRFFDMHAPAHVRKAQIHEGARVLDVATGTGKVALEAARVVGPNDE